MYNTAAQATREWRRMSALTRQQYEALERARQEFRERPVEVITVTPQMRERFDRRADIIARFYRNREVNHG